MKYIISENQRKKVMYDYISSYVKNTFNELEADYKDSFIIIWNPYADEDEDAELILFEYDSWDGRLWISKDYIKKIRSFVPMDISDVHSIIKDLFESTFDVNVKFVKS